MKLKLINKKYNKEKLYKIALQIAINELVLNSHYSSNVSVRNYIMKKAKKKYNY